MSKEIASELRPALVALEASVKKCDKHIRVVEAAYGVKGQGEAPSDLEQRRARHAMPVPLETLTSIEKEIRQQHWRFLNALRGLLGKLPLPIPKDEPERRRSFQEVLSDFKNKDL